MKEITRTTISINPEIYENLKVIAEAKGKTFNQFINEILKEKLNSYGTEKVDELVKELREL